MQSILAVVLLAIAALEGVVAAPLASAAAIDVRTNEAPQASPAFDGAEDIYGEVVPLAHPSPRPFSSVVRRVYMHTPEGFELTPCHRTRSRRRR
ncbi:uncharacterized protein PG986_013380 [Apiospora aurea]|uniref:Uncharacterized protein n=1 Tax=Apiospora aurea TaxID=335848 RepID=A0ABR1PVE4_9PEZI